MALHKSEGIILHAANWSESSQMLTLLTPDRGRLSLSMKGIRKLSGKRGRPLRFARLELTFYLREGAETGSLNDVEPIEVFLFEKDGQLGRLTFAAAALELLNGLTSVQEAQSAVYQISLSFLRMVDSIEKKRLPGLFAGYILRLVSLAGFRPNLVGCTDCGRVVSDEVESDEDLLFSAERGGMVCLACRGNARSGNGIVEITAKQHLKFRRLMESSLGEASQISVSLADLQRLIELVTELLRFHAGTVRHLKSFDFLDKLTQAVKTYGG